MSSQTIKEPALQEIYLNFHGLGVPPQQIHDAERPYWIAVEQFEAILQLVREHESKNSRVRFTFDDGNQSDIAVALPLLQKYGRRATFFLISDTIGRTGFLAPADVARLRDAGMAIGSHGAAHVKWTSLSNEELEEQVSRSLQILSELSGEAVTTVAVPFGDYDRRVLGVLARLGIASVHTSDGGPARSGAWIKSRTSVRADIPIEPIKALVSGRLSIVHRFHFFARRWVRRLR